MMRTETLPAPRHAAQYAVAAAAIILLLCIVAAFVLPLARTAAFLPHAEKGTGYSARYILQTAAYTLAQALASMTLAVLAGMPAAYLVARKQFPGRSLLAACASVPLCIPALIMALGYITTFGMAGTINRAAMFLARMALGRGREPPFTFLYSFWGIVMTQGFYNFPLVMATVADSWATTDASQEESARLLGASGWRIFRTLTIFQLLPAIFSACIPVFLYCFFSFMIVLLFGTVGSTTLEVAIYHAGRSSMQFGMAARLALIETACALAILLGYSAIESRATHAHGTSRASVRPLLSGKGAAPFILYLAVLALFFALPLAAICAASFRTGSGTFTLDVWRRLCGTRSFFQAFKNTLLTATGTACACTVAGFTFAAFMRLGPESSNARAVPLMRLLPLLPMAVSSVLLGLGMTLLVRQGSPLLLVAAQSALGWPFAFRQMYAALRRIPQHTIDAARLLTPHRLETVFRILIPCSWRAILSSLGFCFAISAGDATLPLVLAIPRFDTLALYTYRLAGSYRLGEACAAGLALGALCMVVFAAGNRCKEGTRWTETA